MTLLFLWTAGWAVWRSGGPPVSAAEAVAVLVPLALLASLDAIETDA